MNPTNEPANQNPPPLLPVPVPPDAPPGAILQALLRRPVQLVAALQQNTSTRLTWILALFALLALAGYGLVVGSFSGGQQWLAAPLKVSLGVVASVVICLPSLFIFTSLSGAEVTLRGVAGALCAVLALTALMLIGLAPVAWVFSQSTDSTAFMGTLHILFWLVALSFGLRLLGLLLNLLGIRERLHLKVWATIFVLVSLQMTTALRPIIGTSDHWLPAEKKFFVAYWFENVVSNDPTPARSRE
jgi:hypothetical protein